MRHQQWNSALARAWRYRRSVALPLGSGSMGASPQFGIAREARKRIKGIQSLAKMRVMAVPEWRSPVSHGGRHEVLVRVQACGVCHSDCTTVQGPMPKIGYPRIPGHEGIGVIDAVGADVDGWKVGSHVGVQWFLRLLRPVPARQCVCL